MLDAIHLDEDFVQLPLRSDARSLPSPQRRIKRAELLTPFSNRFIRHPARRYILNTIIFCSLISCIVQGMPPMP
jgi:hypothetical protein